MSAANKKFRQLSKQIHGWKAKDIHRDSEGNEIGKYPNCPGTYDDCPEKIDDPKEPPGQCRSCPVFKESEFGRPKKREIPDFIKEAFRK